MTAKLSFVPGCRALKDVLSRFSALNLAYYLAVRCHDLRPVQERLLPLGLSSLGRSEARTMANLDAVMATLGRLCKKEENLINYPSQKWFFHGDKLLDHNTGLIFGAANNINTHIMVTLPPEAADDYKLVRKFIGSRYGYGSHQLCSR